MATLIDPADAALLAELLHATREPFRDPVRVQGVRIPRRLARHMERLILKVRAADRREFR
jgi:hypothetical protein